MLTKAEFKKEIGVSFAAVCVEAAIGAFCGRYFLITNTLQTAKIFALFRAVTEALRIPILFCTSRNYHKKINLFMSFLCNSVLIVGLRHLGYISTTGTIIGTILSAANLYDFICELLPEGPSQNQARAQLAQRQIPNAQAGENQIEGFQPQGHNIPGGISIS